MQTCSTSQGKQHAYCYVSVITCGVCGSTRFFVDADSLRVAVALRMASKGDVLRSALPLCRWRTGVMSSPPSVGVVTTFALPRERVADADADDADAASLPVRGREADPVRGRVMVLWPPDSRRIDAVWASSALGTLRVADVVGVVMGVVAAAVVVGRGEPPSPWNERRADAVASVVRRRSSSTSGVFFLIKATASSWLRPLHSAPLMLTMQSWGSSFPMAGSADTRVTSTSRASSSMPMEKP